MEMKQYLIDTFKFNDTANKKVLEKIYSIYHSCDMFYHLSNLECNCDGCDGTTTENNWRVIEDDGNQYRFCVECACDFDESDEKLTFAEWLTFRNC